MSKKKKVVIVSGGFDPLHEGHIALFKDAAKCVGEEVKIHVLLNSDAWLTKKKGKNFQSFETRKSIIENLKMVENVYGFEDDLRGSCVNGIQKVIESHKNSETEFYFCNGGDRKKTTTPEDDFCDRLGVNSVYGVGGEDKKNSSSDILKKWNVGA